MVIQPITDESLSPLKKIMVAGRLQKRLLHFGFSRYGDYYRLVTSPGQEQERQRMVDLLTTNETYFFREPAHFDFVRDVVIPRAPTDRPLRLWSAASSSGEEVYSLAMVLADHMPRNKSWEILGSDLSTRVLKKAVRGLYSLERTEGLDQRRLRKYCLKGVGEYAGMFLIDKQLKAHCRFRQINLKQPLPSIGRFDTIFIRNIMIYFDQPTKVGIVNRVASLLVPGGYFVISHTESLRGVSAQLEMIKPSVFQKR
jgi:chemotaxis protein methyltransferase CheR